jgi:radical SAM superfamily enzyme YgiQ (UPF0313 family)
MVAGPGEAPLIRAAGKNTNQTRQYQPDYDDLEKKPYLSPGFVLPFSSASGCWWRRCNFCPENAEKAPYYPLPRLKIKPQLKKPCSLQPTIVNVSIF